MATSSTYVPQAGAHVGRPPCATCGADFHLHRPEADLVPGPRFQVTGRGLGKLADAGAPLFCPEPYRPDTLQAAVSALQTAQGRHDPAATFAARGDLQRLLGRGHTWDGCIGCQALTPEEAR